jgi:NADPH:quinone reductase
MSGSFGGNTGMLPMKAVLLRRFGGPEVLEVGEIAKPSLRAGEILVRVKAAGVNYFETLMRQGRYGFSPALPMTPGVEIAGAVEETGKDAGVAVGSRVAVPLFALGASGGYAQFVAVDARAAQPIPDGLSFEQAVALMVQGLTALHAARRVSPAGRTVLILPAAGGVGSLLVQLVRRLGARRVIAAAGSERKLEVARNLGADAGVVYGGPGWGTALQAAADGDRIDVIYDFVGGALSADYLASLAPQGEVLFGALGRADFDHRALNAMIGQNQVLKGMALIPLLTPENLKADLAELFALCAGGALEVLVGARHALDEVAAAHRAIEAREIIGKAVLLP